MRSLLYARSSRLGLSLWWKLQSQGVDTRQRWFLSPDLRRGFRRSRTVLSRFLGFYGGLVFPFSSSPVFRRRGEAARVLVTTRSSSDQVLWIYFAVLVWLGWWLLRAFWLESFRPLLTVIRRFLIVVGFEGEVWCRMWSWWKCPVMASSHRCFWFESSGPLWP